MSIYKGSHKIKDSGRGVFVGSKNTNCLTYTPKHVDVELNPLNANVTGTWGVIADGVAKGFSAGKYLKLPEAFSPENNPWEISFPFILSGIDSSAQTIVGTNSTYACGNIIFRLSNGKFIIYMTSNGTKWDIINGAIGTKVFIAGVKYHAKMSFDGSVYRISYSEDGVNFIDDIVVSNTTPVFQGQGLSVGGHYYSSTKSDGYFTKGSIDLSQSYININGERWWSGDSYTKVGSWIDNGVVGSFTTANYLTFNGTETISADNLNSFEIAVKVTTPTTWTSNGRVINPTNGADSKTAPFIQVVNSGAELAWYNGTTYTSNGIAITLSSNTTYWFKWVYDGSTIKSYYSTNGSDYTLSSTTTPLYKLYFNSTEMGIGCRVSDKASVCVWNGSVDLKETYIKVNDSIWWQGGTGDVTLKQGSKVFVPNGWSDGYKVFNELVIPNDISAQSFANSEQVVCYNPETNRLCLVGNDVYDTVNNVMSDNISLPVARCTANAVSVTSIDEVFDWCGRIGNTAFVLPDVKGFIANGIKDTGTYDSTEFTVNKVLTADLDVVTDRSLLLGSDKLDYVECNYNKKDNLLYNTDGEVINAVECGKVTSDGTAITSLTPYVAQPETTAIPIKFIYSGSQLVYKWEPYDPNTVILYGANTGTKTYILDAGLYQCCVVGGGWANRDNWSNAGGAAVEIQFRLTEKATVVVYSGGLGHTAYLNINGTRVATANTAASQNSGGSYSIDTASPYYVSTIVARNGGGANLSVAGSVSPYGGWGAGTSAGGVRLEYITY